MYKSLRYKINNIDWINILKQFSNSTIFCSKINYKLNNINLSCESIIKKSETLPLIINEVANDTMNLNKPYMPVGTTKSYWCIK